MKKELKPKIEPTGPNSSLPVPLSMGPRSLATTTKSTPPELQTWSQQFFVDQPYIRNFVVAASEVWAGVQKEV